METVDLETELAACIGETLDDVRTGRDPVNLPMIRNFSDAIGDTNPVYLDDDAARAAGFPGVVAPPGMLRTWTMLAPAEQMGRPAADGGRVYAVLEAAGYTSKAATNCDLVFERYAVLGDELTTVVTLTGVSALKHTALGEGFFVDSLFSFTDAADEVVANMRWRSLRYRPHTAATSRATAAAAVDAAPLALGPAPWTVPITTTLVVAGAFASRDYQDVHHDPALARMRGAPDIFMNMMTSTGLVCRYVTDWVGPTARLRGVALTLGVPNHPGDVMEMSASGVSVTPGGGIALTVTGTNSLGRHVRARVTLDGPPTERP